MELVNGAWLAELVNSDKMQKTDFANSSSACQTSRGDPTTQAEQRCRHGDKTSQLTSGGQTIQEP